MTSLATEGALGAVLTGLMVLRLPPRLAERHRRRPEHPVRPLRGGRRPLAHRPDDQPDDARRPRPGHRHPGRRGDRRDREHPRQDGAHREHPAGRPAGEPRHGRAAAAGDALHPRRLHPVVLHAGGGPGPLRPALARRRLRDGLVLPALQHVRPGPLGLAPPPPAHARGTSAAAFALRPVPRRLRPGPRRRRPAPLARRPRLPRRRPCSSPTGSAGSSAWRSSRGSTPGGSSSASRPRPGRGSRRPSRSRRPRSRPSAKEVGEDAVEISVGYVGVIPSSYPINAIYQWTGGPEEVAPPGRPPATSRASTSRPSKRRLRDKLTAEMPDVQFSFEPADIVSDVMSFGSPTPVEVAVSGPNFADDRAHAAKVQRRARRRSPRSATSSTPRPSTTRR